MIGQDGRVTIADFLLARIAEDWDAADSAGEPIAWITFRQPDGSMHHTALGSWVEEGWLVDGNLVQDERAVPFYVPERVMADCEAKRQIVELHAEKDGDCRVCGEENGWTGDGAGGEWFDHNRTPTAFPCRTLTLLAAVYADHPDHDAAWVI